jgi:hypothetical protein
LGLGFGHGLALDFRSLAKCLDLSPQRFLLEGELFSFFINFYSQSLQVAKALHFVLDTKPSFINPLLLLNSVPTRFVFQFTKPASFFFCAEAGVFNKLLLVGGATMRFLFHPNPCGMLSLQPRVLLAAPSVCFQNLFLRLLSGFLVSFFFALPTRLSLLNGSKLFLAGLAQRLYFHSQLLLLGGSLLSFLFVLLSQGLQLRQPTILFFRPEPRGLFATQSALGGATTHLFEAATLIICSHFHFRFKYQTFLLSQTAGFFLNLDAPTRFRQFEYFGLSPLARSLYFCSDLGQLLACSLQGFLLGTQSFSFRAMVSLPFRAQTSNSVERTFMFGRAVLLFDCLTLQFFYPVPRLLRLQAVFSFQAQAFLFHQPPGRFFGAESILYFLQPAGIFFSLGSRSVDLSATAREALLQARQRFFLSLQTKQFLGGATAGFFVGSPSDFLKQLSFRCRMTVRFFQTLPFFISTLRGSRLVEKTVQ